MHEALVVDKLHSLQNRRKHSSRLFRRQRPLWKNLGKILFRVLLHDIKQNRAVQLAAARLENTNQIRMVQVPGSLPSVELLLRVSRAGRDHLDGGFLGPPCGALHKGKEHSTVIGTSQIAL